MKFVLKAFLAFGFQISFAYGCIGTLTDDLLCETPEILFESDESIILKEKATQLGGVVDIYEYVRNGSDYAVYHGARSSSLNAFLGAEGNDVDLASTLIALYRSVGVKSRYVVGNIKVPKADVANWVSVENEDLAISILKNQGINVIYDTDPTHVTFEHVWVEALVDFANYRGGGVSITNCDTENDRCRWVSLDPSFKLRDFRSGHKDKLESLSFNYDAYYNAESDQLLRDKSPLEIFEEQALGYLRENHPGVTLEDVIDRGEIRQEVLGLLPSSLPYEVIGDVDRFVSIVDHDASSSTIYNWNKVVQISIHPVRNGVECSGITFGSTSSVAELSTKQLTINWLVSSLLIRLDGESKGGIAGDFNFGCGGVVAPIELGSSFNVVLEVDASPYADPIEVRYDNLVVGGYYLVATGGETSNWSQVRRAYQSVLAASEQYPLVENAGGDVYVDANSNGSIDAGELLLLDDQVAQDALTGGLLYTAQALYYARLKQESRRYSRLKNIISPISAFVGIVSTTYEVETVDETPFAVLPGGLLIDLKGIRINGSWLMDEAETYSTPTFKFLGHIASSLEHEVWQELTGYDAISTMRGIQFALDANADLMDIHNNSIEDSYATSLSQMGLANQAPGDFIKHEYEIFDRHMVGWEYTGSDSGNAGFYVFKGDLTGVSTNDYRYVHYTYNADNGVNNFYSNYDVTENQLNVLIANNDESTATVTCNNKSFQDVTLPVALVEWETCFNEIVDENANYINFFDKNEEFIPSAMYYKDKEPALTDYSVDFVIDVRDHLYDAPPTVWFNFVAPSKLTSGPFFVFEVFIKDTYDASNDNLISSSYIIKNESMRLNAGGGYVPEGVPVNPATDTEGVEGSGSSLDTSGVTFNNEVFTDQNLVAIANNDVVRTPSTVDPVSTVTGNMYHDETDLVIVGKGLPYTFTRTYNSNETSTDGPDSSNPGYLPFSQGWTHSYNMKLVANDYGQYPGYDATLAPENNNNKTSSISYVDERGGESNYLLDDGSTFSQPTSPRAGFDNLVLNSPSSSLHTISYSNGVKYIFDSQGLDVRTPGAIARLHRIEDAYGNQLNFDYTSNQLTSVTDNLGLAGRSGLTLSYFASGANNGRLQYLTDWSGRQWEYIYTNGKLSGAKNPLDKAMAYTYVDGTHWLKDIVHPQDRNGQQKTMTFSYYENGQAYDYVDKNGYSESLIYDLFRRRTRVTNPRDYMTEHYYDENGALIKLVEPDKGILLFENNEDGLRYVKHNALGQRTRYSYNTSRALTGVASNTNGQVTREEDALGYTTDYDYGLYDQITTTVDKNGNEFANTYYASTNTSMGAVKGRLQKTVAAAATVNGVLHTNVTLADYQYHPDGTLKKMTEYIDPAVPSRKRITNYIYTYADNGTYTLVETTTGGSSSYTVEKSFDSLWRLTSRIIYRRASATDLTLIPLTTTYSYDDMGRVAKTTVPRGDIVETIYDDNGKVSQNIIHYKRLTSGNTPRHSQCYQDSHPLLSEYDSCVSGIAKYDVADRLVSKTDVMGATTYFDYDEMGNILKTTNANGNVLTQEYDEKGRRTKVTDEKGYTVKSRYDLAGRVLEVTDANGNSLSYTYDALGRKKSVTSPEGRSAQTDEYDGNGNAIKLTDANGVAGTQPKNSHDASIYNVFDEFNRLVSTLNANNEQTQYTFDLLGNRTSVTDAKNQKTTFVYDDLGRLTKVIDPIIEPGTDKVVTMTYDEVGNRMSYTDRLGEVTRYGYDNLNRLVTEEYLSDNTTAMRSYGHYGDMISTSYDGNVYTFGYDAAHRLLSKTDDRNTRTMSWVYDDIGNLISKTNYQGEKQSFVYDSSNRLVSMSAGDPVYIQASYHYDPGGRLLSRILSNGSATLYNYTLDGFLTSIKQIGADGNAIDQRDFQHDEMGNIKKLTINNSEVVDYAYDPAYRLLSANSSINSHDLSYTYDAVGNRLTKTTNGSVQHFIYSTGNRLDEVRQNSIGGSVVYSFDYDANGSMVEKFDGNDSALLDITYDQRRLATVMGVNAQADAMAFEYDANAYRIEKQNAEGVKIYYLEAEHLESVYDDSDSLQATYLRGVVVDEIINGFEINSSEVLENKTFHHDQVNSVVALSDHNGISVHAFSYGPFGENFGVIGDGFNTMKYTGREQDAESGLYYYRARYYDPELGRFISEDPIGFRGGINFYAYVGNNPLINNDPSGNCANICTGLVGGAIGLAAQGASDLYTAAMQEGDFYSNLSNNVKLGDYVSAAGTGFAAGSGGLLIGMIAAPVGNLIKQGVNNLTGQSVGFDGGDFVFDSTLGLLAPQGAKQLVDAFIPSGANVVALSTVLRTGNDGFGVIAGQVVQELESAFVGGIVKQGLSGVKEELGRSANANRSAGSAGGFVLYPSKINSNMARLVYAK